MKDSEREKEKESFLFGKKRYKFWVLFIIILLAFWSMLSGTASLRRSAGNLGFFVDDLDIKIHDDFDALEIEAREKMVRHMWDVYVHNPRLKMTSFWQEAFRAAFEELESEVPGVRDNAITEIAKMSLRSIDMDLDTKKLKRENGKHDKRKHSKSRKIK